MNSPSLAAAILAGFLTFGLPLIGPFERRIYQSDPRTPVKLMAYGATVAVLWILTAAAIRIDGLERLLESPTAGAAWLWMPVITSLVLGLAVAAYMSAGLMPLVQSLRGARWRTAYAAAIRKNFGAIPGVIPNNATERAGWVLLSFSAGICEEVVCRGFLIRFLQENVGGMPLFGALIGSSLIFGMAHLYQGAKGILGTSIGGLALGSLFLLSGSLIPSIVLHIILDLQVVYIMRPVQTPRLNK